MKFLFPSISAPFYFKRIDNHIKNHHTNDLTILKIHLANFSVEKTRIHKAISFIYHTPFKPNNRERFRQLLRRENFHNFPTSHPWQRTPLLFVIPRNSSSVGRHSRTKGPTKQKKIRYTMETTDRPAAIRAELKSV